jgi:transposase
MQLETLGALDGPVINYIKELEASLLEYKTKYLEVKEKYDLLVYQKFVRSAEQLLADKSQALLFTEQGNNSKVSKEVEKVEAVQVKTHKRNKKGRKAIDPKIPRREKIIDIAEVEKTCACGAKLSRIGEETSEKLHITPPELYVERTVRPKYACCKCEGAENVRPKVCRKPAVRIMPAEPSIIPRSIVSPGLLSCIMIQKYEDHLPFYRQEKQFERIGIRISRQDMC